MNSIVVGGKGRSRMSDISPEARAKVIVCGTLLNSIAGACAIQVS